MNALRYLLILPIITSGALLAQPPGTGSITGTIRYLGDVPPNQRISTTDGGLILHNDIVVHPKTKGLRDVILVLDWKGTKPLNAQAKPVVIDQREMLFIPRAATVQEGQVVRFENSDICNHAVQAQSIHPQNVFNVTTPGGQPYEHKFKAQKNPIPIGCTLHPWMRCWIVVMPHPYHAVSDAQGTFRIDHVPAGKHALLLIHPDTNYRESISIEVQACKAAEIMLDWNKLKK